MSVFAGKFSTQWLPLPLPFFFSLAIQCAVSVLREIAFQPAITVTNEKNCVMIYTRYGHNINAIALIQNVVSLLTFEMIM